MKLTLTLNETRVLGCLMEKSVTTPDQYPLTLNALVAACNQKSSRNPVLSLEPGEVQRTLNMLQDQHLVSCKDNFNGRAERYTQRFCNTPFAEIQLSQAEFAVVTLLLLRGPQTPGELRSRSGRLCQFADNAEVTDTLSALATRADGALVMRLPRQAGRQDAAYAHLLAGEIAVEESEADASAPAPAQRSSREDRMAALERRLAVVEQELETLKQTLAE